jgi:putative lipoprotein
LGIDRRTVTEVLGEAWGNDDPATLVIDNEMNLSIFGGCNRFSGQLVFLGERLMFSEDFAATSMACPDEVEMLERRFLSGLRQVVDYLRYGAGLIMTNAKGHAVLYFVETPE